MHNYSILQRNTLDGLSEIAGIHYLRMLDVYQGDERRAFFSADQLDRKIGRILDYIFRNMPTAPDAKLRVEVSRLLEARWFHNFIPSTRSGIEGE
jgi:hypothetical protein